MRTALLAIFFAGLLAACGGDASVSVDFEESPSRVVVTAGTGTVTIDGTTSRSGSSVTSEQSGTDADPAIEIDENGVMTIADNCSDGETCEVDYVVLLTEGADVEVTTAGGNVVIGELTGDMTVSSGGGDVTLTSSIGDLQIATGGGDVLGTRLETSAATIETAGGMADVTFDEPLDELLVITESGRLTVQLSGGPYAFDVDAGGGTTSVLVDEDDDAPRRAVLHSGGGNITVYRR